MLTLFLGCFPFTAYSDNQISPNSKLFSALEKDINPTCTEAAKYAKSLGYYEIYRARKKECERNMIYKASSLSSDIRRAEESGIANLNLMVDECLEERPSFIKVKCCLSKSVWDHEDLSLWPYQENKAGVEKICK